MKTALTFALLATSLSFAQNIPTDQVNNIRSGLSVRSDVKDLKRILETSQRVESPTISSSFYFKQHLSEQSQKLKLNSKYGSLVPIDPALSYEKYDEKIETNNAGICYQALVTSKDAMDTLLTDVIYNFASKKGEETSATRNLNDEQRAIRDLIKSHLAGAPANDEGQTLSSIVGNLYEAGLRKNRVRVLRFDKDGISLSLSSLISLRSGDDQSFVDLQECLVKYLGEQRDLFSARTIKMDQGEKLTPSALLFKENMLNEKALMPVVWSELKTPQQIEAARLQFFMEGHQFSDINQEKSFMFSRLGKIKDSLEFLEGRLKSAKKINALSRQLNKKQLDFLIDLMIQLNQDVLPSSAAVSLTSVSAQNALKGENTEEFFFQRQTHRDLLTLSDTLAEEKRKEEAKKKDLQALQLM